MNKKSTSQKPSTAKHPATKMKVTVKSTEQKNGKFKSADLWFQGIQDKEVRWRLYANTSAEKLKALYPSMTLAIRGSFGWAATPEGADFWDAIFNHFDKGEGLKTFADFKHLLKKQRVDHSNDMKKAPDTELPPGGFRANESPKEPEKDMKAWEFIEANNMNFHLGSIVDNVYSANQDGIIKRKRLSHLKEAQVHLSREIELQEKNMKGDFTSLIPILAGGMAAIGLIAGILASKKGKKEEEKK